MPCITIVFSGIVRLTERSANGILTINPGVVKVSTGVMKLEKLSAGDASNHKPKYKRRR